MKIGFSSLVCPAWDLETIITNSSALGFDGIELRGVQGDLHLPLLPELAHRPDAVAQRFAERKVELVCLGTSATLDSRQPRVRAQQKSEITEFVELAAKLRCPYVRIFVGEVQRRDNHRAALARIAHALEALVPVAAQHGVTILVENGSDFPGSDDMWFLMDAVDHPAIKVCWNQCHAKTVRERPTNSLPRLGCKIGLVHVCDASFDPQGTLLDYKPLGEGDAEVERQIELLRGLVYDGYLIFEWPKMWIGTLPSPETTLPQVAKFLREQVAARQPILSAYKGDKQAPRLASRSRV